MVMQQDIRTPLAPITSPLPDLALVRKTLWQITSFSQPCGPVVVVEQPEGFVGRIWRGIGVRPEAWPQGGVFAPRTHRGLRKYVDLTEEKIPAVLDDVANVRPDDPASLAEFLGRWGQLGVGIPRVPKFPFDGVRLTAEWMRHLQTFLRGVHEPAGPRTAWRALRATIPVPPQVGDLHLAFTRDGPRPMIFPNRLLDVLLVELSLWPLEAAPPRCCDNCGRVMLAPASRRRFCSPSCGNRFRVRKARKKRQALVRLARGESVTAVARRYDLPRTQVRRWLGAGVGGLDK